MKKMKSFNKSDISHASCVFVRVKNPSETLYAVKVYEDEEEGALELILCNKKEITKDNLGVRVVKIDDFPVFSYFLIELPNKDIADVNLEELKWYFKILLDGKPEYTTSDEKAILKEYHSGYRDIVTIKAALGYYPNINLYKLLKEDNDRRIDEMARNELQYKE